MCCCVEKKKNQLSCCYLAAIVATFSIHAMIWPPNVFTWWLACVGRASSTLSTRVLSVGTSSSSSWPSAPNPHTQTLPYTSHIHAYFRDFKKCLFYCVAGGRVPIILTMKLSEAHTQTLFRQWIPCVYVCVRLCVFSRKYLLPHTVLLMLAWEVVLLSRSLMISTCSNLILLLSAAMLYSNFSRCV